MALPLSYDWGLPPVSVDSFYVNRVDYNLNTQTLLATSPSSVFRIPEFTRYWHRDPTLVAVNSQLNFIRDNNLNLVTIAAPTPVIGINHDWPNPRGYVPSILLRTDISPVRLELIGKDKFFGGPGQPPANLDWPVPKGKEYPSSLRSLFVTPLTTFKPPPILTGKDPWINIFRRRRF